MKKFLRPAITVTAMLVGWMAGGGTVIAQGADFARVPGVVIDHSPASSRAYIGSPSLAILPGGEYVASHDLFGQGSDSKTTRIFGSADRGQSWRPLATLEGQYWSTLFVHRAELYILGTGAEYGPVVIRRSRDGGRTWTTPRDSDSGLLRADGRFHGAPTPVLEHQGRLWRGMEDAMGPDGWGTHFRAFMMSAPVDSDLLNAANWTSSEPVARNPAWLGAKFNGWLEGNAVTTRAGDLVNLLRVDDGLGGERAAILRISADGRRAAFDPDKDFIAFPGGAKKFTIRFDPVGGRYWSLVNPILPDRRGPAATSANPGSIRNTLALASSGDLREWTLQCVLLHHPDREHVAFQYVDWQFDGEDLIAVSRTAFDDGLGGAPRGHDANFMTFHRFARFRSLTMKDSVAQAAVLSLEMADLVVTAVGAELAYLEEGGMAFSNRSYTWDQVPAALHGWRYTRSAGGEPPQITVKARRDTAVMMATADGQPGIDLRNWTRTPDASFGYNDREHTRMGVYKRTLASGEDLMLPQGNWTGSLLLLPPPEAAK